MKQWTPETVASAAGADLAAASGYAGGPEVVTIDSRAAGPGSLFIGLPGENVDGGTFAAMALEAGAWGVLVGREHAEELTHGATGVVAMTWISGSFVELELEASWAATFRP